MNVPAAGGVTIRVPESPTVPFQAPLASHPVAFELDQVSVVDSPTVSAVGLALMLTMTGLPVLENAELFAAADPDEAPPPPPPHEASRRHAATVANCRKARTRE